MQAIEEALSGTGSAECEFKKYTISVSPYYQGKTRSGVRVTWRKK
jgi:hypothetical protein